LRIFDLLSSRQFQDDRDQQLLALDAALGLLPQNFFEQDALVRHVLVDNPESIAACRNDKAVVNLTERRRAVVWPPRRRSSNARRR
jgi:hypothetical protein